MGRKKDCLRQRRDKMTHRRRYHYNEETPFIELLKPQYQRLLIVGDIAKEFKSLLRNGDKVDVRTMTFLKFKTDNSDPKLYCAHKQIYVWFAHLLITIGKQGTRYGESTIFRYITDGHNNLFIDELSLKMSVNKYKRSILLTQIYK